MFSPQMIVQLVDNKGRLWMNNSIVRIGLRSRSPIVNDLVINSNNQLVDIESGIVIIDSNVVDMVGINSVAYVLLHNGNVLLIQTFDNIRHVTRVGKNIQVILSDASNRYIILIDSDSNYLSIKPSNYDRTNLPSWLDIIMSKDGIVVTTSTINLIDVELDEVETYSTPMGLVDIAHWNDNLLGISSHHGLIYIHGEGYDVIDQSGVNSPVRGFLRSYEVNDDRVYFYCENGSIYTIDNSGLIKPHTANRNMLRL